MTRPAIHEPTTLWEQEDRLSRVSCELRIYNVLHTLYVAEYKATRSVRLLPEISRTQERCRILGQERDVLRAWYKRKYGTKRRLNEGVGMYANLEENDG